MYYSRYERRQQRSRRPGFFPRSAALDATQQKFRYCPYEPGRFDSRVAEPGPSPIVTPHGIVLIYNGADDKLVYRTGIAVFDRNDPRKLLWRSDEPVFSPEKDWEKVGQVPNVVFVEGMVKQGNQYLFYYGGADKYVGVAEATASR